MNMTDIVFIFLSLVITTTAATTTLATTTATTTTIILLLLLGARFSVPLQSGPQGPPDLSYSVYRVYFPEEGLRTFYCCRRHK
jgi:hypothetical protein